MTSIKHPLPTSSLPDYSALRSRRETDATGTPQHVQGHSQASSTPRLHEKEYVDMFNALQKMTPQPTLDAIRAQVPDNDWNDQQGQPSYGLSNLLETPMAKEMGRMLRQEFGDLLPGKSELSWSGMALTVLLTKGVYGDPGEIAGFDMDAYGQTPGDTKAANLFPRLKQHLIDTGRTTPELANAAAYVLLWQSAPVYLLQKIPADVDRFSSVWEQTRKTVSRLTENDDQATLWMTYDHILDILDPKRVEVRSKEYI